MNAAPSTIPKARRKDQKVVATIDAAMTIAGQYASEPILWDPTHAALTSEQITMNRVSVLNGTDSAVGLTPSTRLSAMTCGNGSVCVMVLFLQPED
jgi:hypothetical protein